MSLRKIFSNKLSEKDYNREQLKDEGKMTQPWNTAMYPGTLEQKDSLPSQERKLQRQERVIHGQERTIEDLRSEIKCLQEDENTLQAQASALFDELKSSKAEIKTLGNQIKNLEEHARNSNQQAWAADEKDRQLLEKSYIIQELRDDNDILQKRVAQLEEIVTLAGAETRTDLRSFYNRYKELEKSHDDITSMLNTKGELCSELRWKVEAMKSENTTLESAIYQLQQEASLLESALPQTLRSLLTLRLVEATSTMHSTDNVIEAGENPQNWSPAGLAPNTLDNVCIPAELQSIASLLPRGQPYNNFYQRLKLDLCSVCSRLKFKLRLDNPFSFMSVKWISEYLGQSRFFACCYERVCKECFTQHLLNSLEFKWWYKLGTLQWFSCPRDGCDNALGICCEADLQICLERNCDTPAEESVKTYIKALAFRGVLENLNPRPGDEVLRRAMELNQHLTNAGRMYSYFDRRFDSTSVDENGCIPEFNPGTIFSAEMETGPSPVPIFIKFFRRQNRPKTCTICNKTLFDIDWEDVDSWKAECEGFQGPWMWSILAFPISEVQKCDHDFEFCRSCTSECIRRSIADGGPSACESITCPQCFRVLSYQEVRQLTDSETVTKYEKFLVRNLLSRDANFRWCLNASCENGQQYQTTPRNPRISCEACGFKMCFKHEMPWHVGQTCDEYDSQREHGDPSYQRTREWIGSNTKKCPSCNIDIQKGEACFHMTCSQCNHQFCWQCLADWEQIRSHGQEGHREECFFRTHNIRPTGIRGESLEDALQARSP